MLTNLRSIENLIARPESFDNTSKYADRRNHVRDTVDDLSRSRATIPSARNKLIRTIFIAIHGAIYHVARVPVRRRKNE